MRIFIAQGYLTACRSPGSRPSNKDQARHPTKPRNQAIHIKGKPGLEYGREEEGKKSAESDQ